MIIEFEDIVVTHGGNRVTWEYIGEGLNGDYDPTDPDDIPLLRFSCDRLVVGMWQPVYDGSYCTLMPVDSNVQHLLRACGPILHALEEPSPKKALEFLSWFSPADFE